LQLRILDFQVSVGNVKCEFLCDNVFICEVKMMTIREEIAEKIKRIPENRLPELYTLVEEMAEESKEGLLKRLQKIKIDGPPDYAENFDLYMSGEKNLDDYYLNKEK